MWHGVELAPQPVERGLVVGGVQAGRVDNRAWWSSSVRGVRGSASPAAAPHAGSRLPRGGRAVEQRRDAVERGAGRGRRRRGSARCAPTAHGRKTRTQWMHFRSSLLPPSATHTRSTTSDALSEIVASCGPRAGRRSRPTPTAWPRASGSTTRCSAHASRRSRPSSRERRTSDPMSPSRRPSSSVATSEGTRGRPTASRAASARGSPRARRRRATRPPAGRGRTARRRLREAAVLERPRPRPGRAQAARFRPGRRQTRRGDRQRQHDRDRARRWPVKASAVAAQQQPDVAALAAQRPAAVAPQQPRLRQPLHRAAPHSPRQRMRGPARSGARARLGT